MNECIYGKQYGGKWYFWLCCHTWVVIKRHINKKVSYEQLICKDCDRVENLILIDWIN